MVAAYNMITSIVFLSELQLGRLAAEYLGVDLRTDLVQKIDKTRVGFPIVSKSMALHA